MGRLAEMQAFEAVAAAGSFTGAAEQLGIAKSAVSRRISDLEARLGVQLLQRTTRRLSLTDEGSRFLDQSTMALAAVEAAEESVRDAGGELTGSLRIAAPLTFGLQHMSDVIIDFARQHPAVSIDTDFSDRRVKLVSEGFDIAIRIGQPDDASLAGRRLTAIRHVVCASPDYLRQTGTPSTPADLAAHRGLVYTGSGRATWHYRSAAGKSGNVQPRDPLRSNNGSFLRDAASAGLGVVMQPLFIAYTAIEAGRLVPLLTDYEWQPMDAWLVYPATRHLSHRTRAFIDHVVAHFEGTPYWEDCLAEPG